MIMLVKEFPELHDLYMALLFRHCPYLAPKFPAKDKNQTAEEFRLSAGYKKGPDDKLESESQFWERMRGYASLYAAYCSIDYLGEDKPEIGKSTRLNSSHIPLSRMPSSA
eukprot:TRINITY_DN4562_c0_g1_i1.p1 TRINITY_DN4562_c0_g1~~TRINITY_DN4562_c0_g1_i1.p1  ORF type:complete len:110 (-),score=21.50 TRINITY_DN4562_c0_g1_i1:76-405(-)